MPVPPPTQLLWQFGGTGGFACPSGILGLLLPAARLDRSTVVANAERRLRRRIRIANWKDANLAGRCLTGADLSGADFRVLISSGEKTPASYRRHRKPALRTFGARE